MMWMSLTEIYHSTFYISALRLFSFLCVHRNYVKRASCSTHIFIYFMLFFSRQEIPSQHPSLSHTSSHISFMSNRFECYTWDDSSSHSEWNRVDGSVHLRVWLQESRGNQLYFSTTFRTFFIRITLWFNDL